MNEGIEDERGLMKKADFKKMFYTSFGRIPEYKKKVIYDMLVELISVDPAELAAADGKSTVSGY